MTKHVVCSGCKARLKIKPSHGGKTVACPKCRTPVRIPVIESAVEQPIEAIPVASSVFSASCPHCNVALQVSSKSAGSPIDCPVCEGRFQTPIPNAKTNFSGNQGTSEFPTTVKTCMLIAGISNVFIGLLLALFLIGLPMIAVGIYGIVTYSNIDSKPPREMLKKAHTLAILEIIVGMLNLFSLVCGIINLTSVNKAKQEFVI